MLNTQIITYILTEIFIIKYGVLIYKRFIKNSDLKARRKYNIITTVFIICAIYAVLSMPVGMRAKGSTLDEIMRHQHPYAQIFHKYECDDYAIVYYKDGWSGEAKMAYYINENGWKLSNKKYYNNPIGDFGVGEKTETRKISIVAEFLKDIGKTIIYVDCSKLEEEIIGLNGEIVWDTEFTNFESISTKNGYIYIGMVDQIIDKNYIITFNGKNYRLIQ